MGGIVGAVIVIVIIAVICYLAGNKRTEEEDMYLKCNNKLVGVSGFFEGQTIPIERDIIIGRDPEKCSLVFPADTRGVSSIHCKVTYSVRGVGITDLKSSCGTFRMNGERLKPEMTIYLEIGDGFYVGEKKNTFLIK